MIFDGPIAPQRKPAPIADDTRIVQWQVVYGDGPRAITREMNVQFGFYPPLETQWDGSSYTRFYINEHAYSAYYRRATDR